MNWSDLVAIEPKLADIERKAKDLFMSTPYQESMDWAICRWFNGVDGHPSLKQQMCALVGWKAENHQLRSCDAYDVAYHRLLGILEGKDVS